MGDGKKKKMRIIDRFARNEAGNFAVMFSLAMIPLVAVAGLAVDYSRTSDMRSKIQSAADGAAMSAALEYRKTGNKDNLSNIAQQYFEANLAGGFATTPQVQLSYPDASSIKVNVAYDMPTTISEVLGVKSLPVEVVSQVEAGGETQKMEIALALDVTGSMNRDNKLTVLKQSAKQFIGDVTPATGPSNVKISVIPFNTTVRIDPTWRTETWLDLNGMLETLPEKKKSTGGGLLGGLFGIVTGFFDLITGLLDGTSESSGKGSATQEWIGCVWDRGSSWDSTTTNPIVGDTGSKYQASPPDHYSTSICGGLVKVRPLTDDTSLLNQDIDALVADGDTNTNIGMYWAMNSLDGNQPYQQATEGSKKIIVLLTDGVNTNGRIVANGGSVSQMDTAMLDTCSEAKGKGIEVYTIRVIDGNQAMLKSCASDDSHFFNVVKASDLSGAFNNISTQILSSGLHFSR